MIVWVTGASSGLGKSVVHALIRHGHQIVAGARSFEDNREGNVCRFRLDVTDTDSVRHFARRALEIFPHADAVIHCAGILSLGSCEETDAEIYGKIMDTDFLGMVRLNREVLPHMREAGGGRIVMFSSINGLLGIPFQSAYTAAKHAVEGYAECLQMEVSPFHIQVCLVEPGDHRGGSQHTRGHVPPGPDSPYAQRYLRGTGRIAHDEANGLDPDRLGEKVAGLLERKHMPFRKRIASSDQHLAVWLHDLLPPSLNHRILQNYYGQNHP